MGDEKREKCEGMYSTPPPKIDRRVYNWGGCVASRGPRTRQPWKSVENKNAANFLGREEYEEGKKKKSRDSTDSLRRKIWYFVAD